MSLIHHNSYECFHSGLDLFNAPQTHIAVKDGQFVEIKPLAALSSGTPIEFIKQGNREDYLDLFFSIHFYMSELK